LGESVRVTSPDPDLHRPGAVDPAVLRRSYERGALVEGEVADDPYVQFGRWLGDAVAAGLPEPNAMVLATADAAGTVSARTVLLKGVDGRGFAFYTNLESRKGRDLVANPQASLVFPWHPMERQVVVCGGVVPIAADEVKAYFDSRPYGSRIGAWASPQSQEVASREELDARYAELAARFPETGEVPVPPHWGGFRVVPDTVDLWAGRPSRLHDRLRYRRSGEGWSLVRLAP
jgi:pyridoxamine 5'-phosphate oxidase